ncbi:modification methylase [Massilimicrobiota sp. An142]|uniref:DNA adenine methylase n=1 Tax=Massilimicrobiota sp. An142 TaxID=1965564 RepID=UPI000B369642|nr:DNA adenine methylase [Massilimicrobiota sp. An142]OUQ08567.1 modification methylase [Massilimicrobiota sp. An142]
MNNKKQEQKLNPVVKWAGGKRQLLDEITEMIPDNYTEYIEPFLGGGAVLFGSHPEKAVINDCNEELMNVYKVIRDNPDELIKALENHSKNNSSDYFYKVRAYDRDESIYNAMTDIEKAARTLYLNKTCYNGLYRVNKSGQFNTPYGKYKNPNITNEKAIREISKYLNDNNIEIRSGDYKNILDDANEGSFVYMDPPYMPISNSSAFAGYTSDRFNAERQAELKEACDELDKKGVRFLQSNSDCEYIRELYKDYNMRVVRAKRNINCESNGRSAVNELLIYNY